MRARKRKNRRRNLNYVQRNGWCSELGFKTYAAYLKSDLWKEIRAKVMVLYAGKCCQCDKTATQVHHNTYTKQNIFGTCLSGLFAICGPCHTDLEFTKKGKKRLPPAVKVKPRPGQMGPKGRARIMRQMANDKANNDLAIEKHFPR